MIREVSKLNGSEGLLSGGERERFSGGRGGRGG